MFFSIALGIGIRTEKKPVSRDMKSMVRSRSSVSRRKTFEVILTWKPVLEIISKMNILPFVFDGNTCYWKPSISAWAILFRHLYSLTAVLRVLYFLHQLLHIGCFVPEEVILILVLSFGHAVGLILHFYAIAYSEDIIQYFNRLTDLSSKTRGTV
jgi:hypothetical protein